MVRDPLLEIQKNCLILMYKGILGTAVVRPQQDTWLDPGLGPLRENNLSFYMLPDITLVHRRQGIFDSGCSGHMTGNKDHLDDFEECKGGSVTFGGSKGYITGKGRIRVGNLDFDSVSFVKELGHFNLFSISQICDKQHKVLFTETEYLVVSPDFKMPDENQDTSKKSPRQHIMRLGHINFKSLNKLVKGNLVRGLPSRFQNDHTCVACQIKEEPKKISESLQEYSWVEAMQEELLQFRLQQVWILVVSTSWMPRQAEGIDYDEVFTLVARIEAIREAWIQKGILLTRTLFIKKDKKKGNINAGSSILPWLEVKQRTDWIFISQDKMALTKDEEADEVDVHLYRSMIGYSNVFTLNIVKRIFKYLKGKPNLGLWYPRESSFDLEGYSDSDYTGENLDRKSITGGCQFLGSRLISWQCKKQTIVATSTTEAEYIAVASCCRQVILGLHEGIGRCMASMKYCDKHNQVGFLNKPEESTGFAEIVDFLKGSHISKLQLADVSGISMLPNTEIFEGMGTMVNMKRGFRGVPRPLLPAMLLVVAVDQSAGQADQAVDQPSPSEPLPSSSHPPIISATTESEPTLVAEPTPHPKSPSPEPDSEPIEHTFEQPSPEHQPLSPIQDTKVPQSQDPTPLCGRRRNDTLVKLVKKVKKMEDVLKRRHVVLPDSEDEDAEISSKHGRNL
ncbi:putative ribonuclease H-like domain-containing protein [Tanacetum coccineum]|uniref:Ribonuclease H-like domain-containing protein n=1 Tax=Tanacetum coccineum TaxID=301880 RepID=A0ABQ5G0L6_9ASTR